MQRLTARSAQSHAVPSEFNLDFAWDMSKSEWAGLQRVFDRLAAYEDIGLTPEEIKDNMEMFHSYRHICAGMEPDLLRDLTKMVYGITLDRLAELVQAEVEGRAVVLPCKVGDTVYAIVHCDEVMKDYDDDYVTGTGAITCPFEGECMFDDCDDSNEIIVETCVSGLWCDSDGTWKVFFEHINADIGVSDFGKTVFLTRAAAEQAKGERE